MKERIFIKSTTTHPDTGLKEWKAWPYLPILMLKLEG